MPTPYTGTPTATQAPSPPPGPSIAPIVNLPIDTDPPNASTWQQAYKVLADFVAWAANPRARVSAWAEAIMRYKDARQRDRFVIDHWGMPSGEYVEWREMFGSRTPWLCTGGADGEVLGTSGMKWQLNQTGNGTIGVNSPGIGVGLNFSDEHPVLSIDIDNGATNIAEMRLKDDANTLLWTTNMLGVLTYSLSPVNVNDVTWVHGVCGQGENINTINHGAFFIRPNTAGANWLARTINGAAPTETDTGIQANANTTRQFKIVMVGSGIADDSTTRVLFFIDGVLKANHTSQIPLTHRVCPDFGGFTGGVIGGTQRLLLGPPHWAQGLRFQTP